MSNQEYCQKLFTEYFELSREFLTMDRELSTSKEPSRLNENQAYVALKKKWQAAIHQYWDFLSLLKKKVIHPNDEAQLS